MKFPGRHWSELALTAIVIGLILLPLVFIVHELVVTVDETQPRDSGYDRVGVIPVLRRQGHGPDWRRALLKQLNSDLLDELTGSRRGWRHDQQDDPESLSCHDIDTIDKKERLGRGVTKDVYRGVYRGRSVALKMVTEKVEDITACRRRNKYKSTSECYVYAHYKLMKEMALAMQLDHPNIVKGLGICIRSNGTTMGSHGIISVYEIGDRIAGSMLRRLPWDQRLDMSIEIADLLYYLEHSPLGSLAVWDFKTRQFTLVQGRLKLIDLDDVSAQELPCKKSEDCNVEVDTQAGRANIVDSSYGLVPCVNFTCHGLNAKFNVISATRGLLGESLMSSAPPFVRHEVEDILSLAVVGNLGANELKSRLQQLMFFKHKETAGVVNSVKKTLRT
ncbi:extracellular tyrosine-protein kinase PKDCC-like [Patiria miniata]|uniref:Protein kinase domain-containing protein n=1 Tax=Patiria miniata TaxID=46514 RepID=A0A914B1N6_PATMI|nr:extracellular tyrosine-protein kinase PKDCC-like [Patiria miniata]